MKRRDVITLLGSAAATWRIQARAQQPDRMRRIGVLWGGAEDDPETKARLAAFRQGLDKRGWSEGRNLYIDYRYALPGTRAQAVAKELVASQPDVILVQSTPLTAALQRETRAIPIVFVAVSDPIGSGFIASLPRPGNNLTGLMLFEASVTGKWLAMLKEIAPRLSRVALIHNPRVTTFYLHAAQALAPSLAIELLPSPFENAADIERAIESFARVPNGGLMLTPDFTTLVHRDLVVTLAARHRLPAVYSNREFVTAGGLMFYGIDFVDMFRQAAPYIDRILKGDNPAGLPVQTPTRFETVVNLKTAKALGLTVPPGLLVAADEVIE
jgi:putative tryptophan/tyrosine transport system substrate-binding protein